MLRSIIPFVLVCLGFAAVGLAQDMPLFEWEVSKITADLPPNFHVKPSPWTTRVGESILGDFTTWYGKPLDHSTSFLWQVYTPMENGKDICSPVGSTPVAKRSRNDETIEQVSMGFYQNVYPWLRSISWLLLFLSGIYVWWFAIWYKRPIFEAIVFTALIVVIFCFYFDNVLRPLAMRVMPALPCALFLPSHPYAGALTFNASLSKVHYEMLVVLLAGVCLELGAVGLMIRQTMKAIMHRKESAQVAAG